MLTTTEAHQKVEEQFDDAPQQSVTAEMGMWVFLASEAMIFGGGLTAYSVYRHTQHDAVQQAAGEMLVWVGTVNTAILLISSVTVALAVLEARRQNHRRQSGWLMASAALGTAFLLLKGYEYWDHVRHGLLPGNFIAFRHADLPPESALFFSFYWVLTGLHAVHLMTGVVIVTAMVLLAKRRGGHPTENATDVVGLYWHFVDIVWLWLYPMFYLLAL